MNSLVLQYKIIDKIYFVFAKEKLFEKVICKISKNHKVKIDFFVQISGCFELKVVGVGKLSLDVFFMHQSDLSILYIRKDIQRLI